MYKILVVDDELEIANLIEAFLAKKGFDVVKALSGKEAIDIFNKDKTIDLLILDKRMPEVNGVAVLKELKRIQSPIPVIILTGSIEPCHRVDAEELGYRDFLVKPVHLDELLDKVNEKLGGE